MKLDQVKLKNIVRAIANTHSHEVSCADCFAQLDAFAELVLAGKDAAAALPLVQEHLLHCRDCREEFEALLDALRALV